MTSSEQEAQEPRRLVKAVVRLKIVEPVEGGMKSGIQMVVKLSPPHKNVARKGGENGKVVPQTPNRRPN